MRQRFLNATEVLKNAAVPEFSLVGEVLKMPGGIDDQRRKTY